MSKAVILIPGIKGTKLYDANSFNNDVLWQDVRYNFADFERLELTFEQEGSIPYLEQDFPTIVKPLKLESLAYEEFWNRLDYTQGHKFLFQYDWRLPNKINGERLKAFMDYLVLKSKKVNKTNPITHFDFVTHSMGNMPLRFYITQHGMSQINKIIFVNPPFKGAPDAVSALTVGQGFFFNRDETRKMARSLPAIFELLPTYEWSAIDSQTFNNKDLWKEDNWQKNLTSTEDNEEKSSIEKFKANLKNAASSLRELEGWTEKVTDQDKSKIMVLVKTDDKTLSNIVVEANPDDDNPKNYFDLDRSLRLNEGDGVVPNVSSCHYCKEFATYAFENRAFLDDFKHPFFLKDNRAQRVINGFLNSDKMTDTYDLPVKGRNVKRVKELEEIKQEEDGITHTYKKIKF